MTDEPRILTDLDDEGVLQMTLNRPKRKNAFDEVQWDALALALDTAREDAQVAVVVLTGAGGNFSSGADLSSFSGEPQPPRADGKPSGFFACVDAVFASPWQRTSSTWARACACACRSRTSASCPK